MAGTDKAAKGALRVAIVGGGSAAFAAALRAAEAGAAVTLIEQGRLGGTCVNVGCVPSKFLLRAAAVRERAASHGFDGIKRQRPAVDRGALLSQLQAQVDALQSEKYEALLADNPAIHRVQGSASFEAPDRIRVQRANGGWLTVAADRVLVATGARPAVPAVPGLTDTPYWTSTDALFAEDTPEQLLVLGGGFVALELAQAYARLGSEVTVLTRGPLLRRAGESLGIGLKETLQDEGIRVLTESPALRADFVHGRFTIGTRVGNLMADRLLVATGRTPNTGSLNLAACDVELDEAGAIRVDPRLRSTNPTIFAAGDCTNLPQLVYVAAAAGSRAAVNMTGGEARLELDVLPQVVFTDPQAAWVGFDPAAASARGFRVASRHIDLAHVPRARVNQDTRGFIQLVAERDSGRLLGAQVLAPNGGEIIQSAALALRAGMSVDDLGDELFPYLTLSEGLKLCAQAFRRDITRLSCCAG